MTGVAREIVEQLLAARGERRRPSWLPLSHAWYAAGSMTWTVPIMPECLVPQYSAQKMWYSPSLVAVNQTVL